ncbi:MAG TPA: hypothetical protein ENI29_10200, partial [bacterium]|nr:hypothetical protein [bacterium]
MSNDNNDIMKLSLTISKGKRNKRNIFIEELLKTFSDNQKIVLKNIDNEIKTRLTFYSSTGRSGDGLKHGFKPLNMYISIRNLAILLGIDKTNLLASQNQFHVLYKIEKSLLHYIRLTNGAVNEAYDAFNAYIKEIRLNYNIYKAFRKNSNDDFSMTTLCRLLKIEGNSILFRRELIDYDIIFSRLVNIFLLPEDEKLLGINCNVLQYVKEECYNICLDYLSSIGRLNSDLSEETFEIIFHSLLILNHNIRPPSKQILLADLSSEISPAEVSSAQRSYLYSVLYRRSRMRISHLNNLLRLMRDEIYIKSPHYVIKRIRDYLHKWYWKKFKIKMNGYHRYWDRDELKFTLRKFLFDETLGLDVNVFSFIRLDLGDNIELHHIFENVESIFLRDLAPLLTSSYRSLTFLFKTESEWLISCNTIVQRRMLLQGFSLLEYNDENKKTIESSFRNNSLWEGMCDIIKNEWIERWKDKAEMREEDWYKKYYLSDFYFKYVGLIKHIRYISTLQNVKSKFILWYFEQ